MQKNVALFGMTAKEQKESNPNLRENIRNYTDLKHLLILCNLENIELIKYEKREDIDFSYNIFL